ncbi:hypothetical protein [Amycolatopsis thailandensis]|nr:hypothetical protein [Amycolatopsis thailandensis]
MGGSVWHTARIERQVLAVVHTVTSAGHLLDAVELLETDDRVQVVFTQAPDVFNNGVAEFLRRLGVVVLSWDQARHTPFDLVLAADSAGLHELSGPVVLVAHGVVCNKVSPEAVSGPNSRLVVGLGAPWLLWYGRLVPSVVALSHDVHLQTLAEQCPDALDAAAVTGDLCWDRLCASRSGRDGYRRALGIDDGRVVVAVTSTWGPQSLFGNCREMVFDALCQLPPEEYAVVVTLHPALWFGHGPRQVAAWLAKYRDQGVRVVQPGMGWRGLLTAADVLVGDHGSVTPYAAGLGVPVLRTPGAGERAPAGAAMELVAAAAPEFCADRPFAKQCRRATAALDVATSEAVARRISSRPGRAATLLRSAMYQQMGMNEPVTAPTAVAVGSPRLLETARG